jgi:hypothetical protein
MSILLQRHGPVELKQLARREWRLLRSGLAMAGGTDAEVELLRAAHAEKWGEHAYDDPGRYLPTIRVVRDKAAEMSTEAMKSRA